MVQQIKKPVPKSVLQKVADMEQDIPRIISAVNQGFTQIQSKVDFLDEGLAVLIEQAFPGGAEHFAQLRDERRARLLAEADVQAKAQLEGIETEGDV